MTIFDLQIKLDLCYDDKVNVLRSIASKADEGFFFVDSEDGHCYLFDRYGNFDDITKVKTLKKEYIKIDIKKIVIPNSVTRIGPWMFSCCSGLTNVTIGNNVMSIGNYAFFGCSKLMNVTMPDSVTSIGCSTFSDCDKMKSLIFKNKTIKQVKAIRYYPFGIRDTSIIKCKN